MGRRVTADALDSLDSVWAPSQPDGIGKLRQARRISQYRPSKYGVPEPDSIGELKNARLSPFGLGLMPQGGTDPDRIVPPTKYRALRAQYYFYINQQGQNKDAAALPEESPTRNMNPGDMFEGPDFSAGAFLDHDAGALYRVSLSKGQKLTMGDSLVSPNGNYRTVLQSDGNLVIYGPGNAALRSWGPRPGKVEFINQTDGNLVLYQNGAPVWEAGTRSGAPKLVMQDDANLVLYSAGTPVWSSETNGGKSYSPSKGVVGSITHAVGSVASSVAHAVTHNPVASLVAAPINAAVAIAHGDNVLSTLANHFKDQIKNIKDVAPLAQTVVSFVPGVGSGINAAIAAGTALASGHNISDALMSAAKNALPGGPAAAAAFDAAVNITKAAATGGNIGDAAMKSARDAAVAKFGPVAGQAFDTGLAMAHGQNVQKALVSGVTNVAQGALSSLAKNALGAIPMPSNPLSPVAEQVYSSVGPMIGQVQNVATSLLPAPVAQVAQALAANPALRGLPIERLAAKMGVSIDTARQGVASLVQATAQVASSGGRLPTLAPAHAIGNALSQRMTTDDAMAGFASSATVPAFSPNVSTMRASGGAMANVREIRWHRTRGGKLAQIVNPGASGYGANAGGWAEAGALGDPVLRVGSSGPDVVTWQLFLISKGLLTPPADGRFGPDTFAATQKFQAQAGLTVDGRVGPLTASNAFGNAVGTAVGTAISAVTAPAPVTQATQVTATPAGPVLTTYVVSAGDSMSSIARQFTGNANRWSELAKANPKITNPDRIQVGQVLTLPASWGTKPVTATAPAVTPAAAVASLGAPIGAIAANVASAAQQAVSSVFGGTPVTQTIAENPANPLASTPLLASLTAAPAPTAKTPSSMLASLMPSGGGGTGLGSTGMLFALGLGAIVLVGAMGGSKS